MRHRTFSYSEESGRYRTLAPVFYLPGPQRDLVQAGKPGAQEFTAGSPEAGQMEAAWARLMPLTHAAFNRNGRVCP